MDDDGHFHQCARESTFAVVPSFYDAGTRSFGNVCMQQMDRAGRRRREEHLQSRKRSYVWVYGMERRHPIDAWAGDGRRPSRRRQQARRARAGVRASAPSWVIANA